MKIKGDDFKEKVRIWKDRISYVAKK